MVVPNELMFESLFYHLFGGLFDDSWDITTNNRLHKKLRTKNFNNFRDHYPSLNFMSILKLIINFSLFEKIFGWDKTTTKKNEAKRSHRNIEEANKVLKSQSISLNSIRLSKRKMPRNTNSVDSMQGKSREDITKERERELRAIGAKWIMENTKKPRSNFYVSLIALIFHPVSPHRCADPDSLLSAKLLTGWDAPLCCFNGSKIDIFAKILIVCKCEHSLCLFACCWLWKKAHTHISRERDRAALRDGKSSSMTISQNWFKDS